MHPEAAPLLTKLLQRQGELNAASRLIADLCCARFSSSADASNWPPPCAKKLSPTARQAPSFMRW